jgi:D-threo-aldose 1-dehydrogenase
VVVGRVYNSGTTATGRIPGAKYNYSGATEEVMAKVDRIQAIC